MFTEDMFLWKLIILSTNNSRETLVARLSAAILPPNAIASLNPAHVSDWLVQNGGKRFMGTFDGQNFKLRLLSGLNARFRRRGNAVVIVGSIEDQTVRIRLRPPWFVLAFLSLFTTAMLTALVLSFFGPAANFPVVQLLLAAGLILPIVLVGWAFRSEATAVERTLRQVIQGDPTDRQP